MTDRYTIAEHRNYLRCELFLSQCGGYNLSNDFAATLGFISIDAHRPMHGIAGFDVKIGEKNTRDRECAHIRNTRSNDGQQLRQIVNFCETQTVRNGIGQEGIASLETLIEQRAIDNDIISGDFFLHSLANDVAYRVRCFSRLKWQ